MTKNIMIKTTFSTFLRVFMLFRIKESLMPLFRNGKPGIRALRLLARAALFTQGKMNHFNSVGGLGDGHAKHEMPIPADKIITKV